MKLHGSVSHNLTMAIYSARRLRGHRVYNDTLTFWKDLLREAGEHRAEDGSNEDRILERLIHDLQSEITARGLASD